jgi:CelD/BcsL family acetyltransferase involved in cellulose biosynthesis
MDAVEEQWRLFEQSADCTVFQKFDWLFEWFTHVGRRRGTIPVVAVGFDVANRPIVIFPLAIERRGGLRRLVWLGSELNDYNAPLLTSGFGARMSASEIGGFWRDIIDAIRADSRLRFDLIDFDKLPEFIGPQPNPLLGLGVRPEMYSAHIASLERDWNKFYASRISSASRKVDRRKFRGLAQHGDVKFITVHDHAEIERTVSTLLRQKSASYARLGVRNRLYGTGYSEFYHAIVTNPRFRDIIHLSRLDIADAPLATGLGLELNNCYYLVLSSYEDGELARYSPGRAHIHELFRYAIERNVDKFDFTIGDEPYKLDWCDVELKLFAYLRGLTVKGHIVVGLRMTIARIDALICERPRLRRWLSSVRKFGHTLRRRVVQLRAAVTQEVR